MKPLQDLGLSSEDVQNAAKHKTAGIYTCVCSVSKSCCVAIPDYLVTTEPIHWSEASRGESEQPAATAAPPPPRSRSPTWKDCEGPDRCAGRWWRAPRLLGEHPRSRWGAERMRSGWNWKCTWKSKVSFYFPPNWIDVKCMNVLVRNIIQIETAFHSLIHLQNKGHFPGGSCVFNSPFGSPQFLFSSLALQRLLSVICGNQKNK